LKQSVLFVGDVWDLRNGVRSTDYVPRDWWLARVFSFGTFAGIPVELETVLLLTAGLSAGLAVVNMLPIYGLDGYHVVDAIVRVVVGKSWDSRKISRLVNYISWAAVLVALLTVVCSIVQSF
jgi:Zn-dependent protease